MKRGGGGTVEANFQDGMGNTRNSKAGVTRGVRKSRGVTDEGGEVREGILKRVNSGW